MVLLGLVSKSLLRIALVATIIGIALAAYLPMATSVQKSPESQNLGIQRSDDTSPSTLKIREPDGGTSQQATSPELQSPSASPQEPTAGTTPDQLPCFDCPASGGAEPSDVLCPDNCPVITPSPTDPYRCPPCSVTYFNNKPLMMCPMIACRALDNASTDPTSL